MEYEFGEYLNPLYTMESKEKIKWPDEVRLEMIRKSEYYEPNGKVYQYGYYDGYQLAISEVESFRSRVIEELEGMKINTYNSVNQSYYKEWNTKIDEKIERIKNLK